MLTADGLREVLSYDPETGDFFWRKRMSNRCPSGSLAGTTTPYGYRSIIINQKPYLAHRLAWLYVYGRWPEEQIDHINRIKSDNRICNLREATRSQNAVNIIDSGRNTSGAKGVHWHVRKRKWCAMIEVDGRKIWLGAFDCKQQAAAAYRAAAATHFGEFAPR